MPIYEYQCKKCGHRFEKMHRYSDPAPACPECGGEVGQLLSAPAVQFKGSGWYVTDYAKKSSAPKADSKGESKPAEKKGDAPKSTPKSDSKD